IPIALSGAENSLVLWGDQGGGEILADYGIAYSFMLYVNEKFGGARFMRYWQNSTKVGIAGFEDALAQFGYQTTFAQVYHDFAVAMAVDYLIDQGVSGPNPGGRYGLTTLRAQLSFNTTQAYGTPGAPPYGSDYVKVADLAGLSALNFVGAPNIVRKTPWTSSASGPANWAGGAVLRSGHANNSEAWLAREVTLGPGTQTLSFDTYFDIEECYDYAAVRVSTDGGQTFTSLANDLTDDCAADDGQDPRVTAILPGFTGQTPAWTRATFDLSDYAGQTIVLAFAYVTDPAAAGNDGSAANNGLWLDNIAIDDTILSDGSAASLAAFSDVTAFQPIATAYTVQIVGYGANTFTVMQLPLADGKNGALTPAQIAELAGYEYLVAIVTYDAPTGPDNAGPGPDYAPYTLTVTRNGETTTMPGGNLRIGR
ncbi:MAG: immune inhibitor A, partial [Thermomicrobiales bacterium]